MTLAAFADLAEVIGALGVIAGLIFVGAQLRQNTQQLVRGEANVAMAQASTIRMALLLNREVAHLINSEIRDASGELDPTDEMRLSAYFSEVTYVAFNAWQRGEAIFGVTDTLERAIAPVAGPVLTSSRGLVWWRRSRAQFPPDFIAALETCIPAIKPPPVSPDELAAAVPSVEGNAA